MEGLSIIDILFIVAQFLSEDSTILAFKYSFAISIAMWYAGGGGGGREGILHTLFSTWLLDQYPVSDLPFNQFPNSDWC